MFTISQTTRSFTNSTLTTLVSLLLALGTAHAQTTQVQSASTDQANAIAKGQPQIQVIESLIGTAELQHNDASFVPASVDINAMKRIVHYPETAIKNNIFGRFELIVYVGSNGAVNSVNFITDQSENSEMSAIIAAACDAVQKSHFTPATLNKKAVSSAVRIPFSFVL